MTNPDHHAIALNSARVIAAFSGSLEKIKRERAELVSWLRESMAGAYCLSDASATLYGDAYRSVLEQMGEKVDE